MLTSYNIKYSKRIKYKGPRKAQASIAEGIYASIAKQRPSRIYMTESMIYISGGWLHLSTSPLLGLRDGEIEVKCENNCALVEFRLRYVPWHIFYGAFIGLMIDAGWYILVVKEGGDVVSSGAIALTLWVFLWIAVVAIVKHDKMEWFSRVARRAVRKAQYAKDRERHIYGD